MKKVLVLASVASMIDKFNMDNISILKKLGYQVDVACNFKNGSITSQERVDEFRAELESDNIKTYHINIPRQITAVADIIKSYKYVKNLVNHEQYQIVHCHSPIGGIITRLACRKARKKGTKVVYTAHGFHFFTGAPKLNWLIFYPAEKLCARFTDVLITINQEDYNRAKKKFKARRTEYVPGIGIHTKEYLDKKNSTPLKRKNFNINDDDFIITCAGQLSKRKNHQLVIKAMALLKNPKLKFLLIGFGEKEEELKALINSNHLENSVIMTGYRSDVIDIFSIADAFVFPSLQEGLPVALMEAMSVGLPVVCTNIRGNSDLIKNGFGGYLTATDDTSSFAKSLDKLINDPKLCKKMGQINIETMKNFDTEHVNNVMEEIYKSI